MPPVSPTQTDAVQEQKEIIQKDGVPVLQITRVITSQPFIRTLEQLQHQRDLLAASLQDIEQKISLFSKP